MSEKISNNEIINEEHPNTVEYRRLKENIQQRIQSIIDSMNRMNFTEEEKQEILDIIEYHNILKDAAKIPLIQINENCILDEVENKVKENSKLIADNMLNAVNKKMKEIMDGKLKK